MPYLFTSESVSEGHPDKVADQISDAILDAFLTQDPESRVACETLVTTGLTVISGEVTSQAYVDVQKTAREVIKKIGYNRSEYQFDADSCGVISTIHEQSPDIAQGVDSDAKKKEQGAGDQGMMFGYATNETPSFMPLGLELSHRILRELASIRKAGRKMTYLRPDAKSQVTIKYGDDHKPLAIETIVVSTQHDDFGRERTMLRQIKKDIQEIVIPQVIKKLPAKLRKLFDVKYKLFVNPTGKFVIGGPHGDTGLTGRKNYRRYLWGQRCSWRWCVFRQGSIEGRPLGCICHQTHCQECCCSWFSRSVLGTGGLCDRCRSASWPICKYIWHMLTKYFG